jgi:hypothetical protein
MRPTNIQPCTLDAQRRQIILADTIAAWKQNPTSKPPAVWIREYALLPGNCNGETAVDDYGWPCATWFLDASGLHARHVWDYMWFHIFQFVQPWCSLSHPVLDSQLWGQHRHEIGLVSFAPLEDSELIYIEHVWGGTTGGADLERVNEHGILECVRPLMRF